MAEELLLLLRRAFAKNAEREVMSFLWTMKALRLGPTWIVTISVPSWLTDISFGNEEDRDTSSALCKVIGIVFAMVSIVCCRRCRGDGLSGGYYVDLLS